MILRFLAVVLTVFILFISVPGSSFFSWHPTFMSLAYGLILFEGASVFSSSFYKKSEIKSKITIHWILQVTATSLALLGFAVIFYNKSSRNKQHFVTWHGIFGLVTVLATASVSGGGVMAKYAVYLKKYMKPLAIKFSHASFACLTLSLGCVSIITGMNSNFFTKATSQYHAVWKVIMAIPILLVSMVILQVAKSYLPRYKGTKNES